MVKHIVMFKLAEKTSESMEKVISMLKEMVGKIETLRQKWGVVILGWWNTLYKA